MIAKKIKKMKDNKSPGVDGIPPKLLNEIAEQLCPSLAKVFNLSLEEGIVPSEMNEAKNTPHLRRHRGTSQNIAELNISCMQITRNIN